MVPKACRDMLKTRKIASELMKKRIEEKTSNKQLTILNSADFQLIGSDCLGFSPSLAVSSEGNTYLFNCNEGMQRYCYSNKFKLLNLENIFITSHDWSRVSGTYGLSLTLQDVGLPSLTLHSNERMDKFFEAASSFMTFTTGMQCLTKSDLASEYKDSGIRIRPVPIETSLRPTSQLQTDCEDDQPSEQCKPPVRLIAYICSFPDHPGSLDPQRCRELKVPVGRLLAVLKSGRDVQLPDGRLVRSAEVCGPKNEGLNFIVIECPSECDIDAVVSNISLNEVRGCRRSKQERQIDVVIHFSPTNVTNNPKYREWINGFDQTCQHLLLSDEDSAKINFIECYRMQYLLHQIDSEIFPRLSLTPQLERKVELDLSQSQETQMPDVSVQSDDASDIGTHQFIAREFPNLSNNVYGIGSLDRIHIRPHMNIEIDESPLNISLLYREAKVLPDFSEKLHVLREAQQQLPMPKECEPEVVFLGTGSALPSKLRNTSCILLNFRFPFEASVIMDCGEDSYGQMYRFYGEERLKEVLRRLKLIYISHHHADHHLGMIQLLRERRKYTKEPVSLLLPPGIERFLNFHDKNFEDLSDTYEIFSTISLKTSPKVGLALTPSGEIIKSELRERLAGLIDDITMVAVDHCVNSCATVMRFKIGHPEMDTFTLSYSGDARPCQDLIIAGSGCDLLIHEATFDHRSDEDARLKKHSTSREAIDVAKKMNAKFTILTHFSQRLSKIPYFTEDFDDRIGFAFDNMSLKCPTHFARIPIMKPILGTVFKKSLDDIDMKYYRVEEKKKLMQNILDGYDKSR